MNPVETPATLPRLEPGSIERTQLLARLSEARHKPCVLILGPAGSGKTTLALQWRAQALAYGHDFAWMTVVPGDDAQAMLDALFAALDRVDPEIAREAHFIYNRDGELRSPDPIAIAVLRGLMRRSRALVLLIDDYQNVSDARAHTLLQTWLDFAPPHFHLVLVSRSVPPLSLSRLRDKDAVMELGFADLRFALDEVRAFAHSRHMGSPDRDARRLHDITDGWIAGLQLVALDIQRQPERLGRAVPVQNPHDFTAYFNREVLSQLDLRELDAMTCLAAARGFNLALVRDLLGDEQGPALLERMRREHLFLMPMDGMERQGWFRFHPLFRDLLLERLERMPDAQRRQTHSVLSQWFGRRKHLREAVHHGVASGDLEQAADWLDRWARELFLNGELQRLVRAVSELPRAILRERGSLLLWLGWSQLCYRQFAACHDSLAALKDRMRGNDPEARAHWSLLAFSLALQEDDIPTAQALLPAMQAMRQGSDAVLIGGRRNLLSWLFTHEGDFEQARKVMQGAVPSREDGSPLLDSPFGALMSQALRGFALMHSCDMRQAEPALRDALADAERALGPYCEAACNAAGFLSAVLYEVNDIDGLHPLLEPRFDAIERVTLPDALITAAVVRCRLRRLEGNPLEALEGLDRLEELAQRRGLDRALGFALIERLRTDLHMGQMATAWQTLHALQALARRHAGNAAPASRRAVGLAAYGTALVAVAEHDDRGALAALEPVCGPDDAAWLRRDRASVHGLRALLWARLGQHELAMNQMASVLRDAQRQGMVRSLLDLGPEWLALALRWAQETPDADPVLVFYVERLQAQAALFRPEAPPSLAPLKESLSEREHEILRALANAMSNKRIAQALGVSPETVKWHLKNVYGKLGVTGRDDAVARARDLGLVGQG
ncbi:LuxR C-terminal-related transcriptional regulator [Hydrogenophaga sp. NFH-34]|uniref:LuxR C-terminal-related transcriptional regulator n=1 Tax=Hydrogenophaga sp. NFH-34 TaxID=2744446 RepID=UPI001F24A3F2|nr:LuxR C-terminal-related transcriptional regulator [Hydrogenophaga sp. NFH-34]